MISLANITTNENQTYNWSMMDVRVRLVFAEEVGRHVQRKFGLSSCWYLVPRDAKMVGDLAHALLQEFELRKRCSTGLELRLEELPLLATQSIRIVRDNDTIIVQSPLAEDDNRSMVATSESENESPRKRKRMLCSRMKVKGLKKKAVKDIRRTVHDKPIDTKWAPHTAVLEDIRLENSSSTLSSDSGSNSKTSSSSESDNETTTRKRAGSQSPNEELNVVGSASVSCGKGSKANAFAQPKKKIRRRRRRLRQRNRGRQGKDKQMNNETASTQLNSTESALPKQSSAVNVTNRDDNASSLGVQNRSFTTGPRGYSRAKTHVFFDNVNGDQVATEREAALTVKKTNNWVSQNSPASRLAKYGPALSSNQVYGPSSQSHRTQSEFNQLVEENDDASDSYKRRKQEGNGKRGDRWKRSYEIVATVLDEKTQSSSDDHLVELNFSNALTSYPAASNASSRFALKDVIAYKTLTLCLTRCQPVVSEWKCGQVHSTDVTCNTIELLQWSLDFKHNSVTFYESPSGELSSVQVSDITELRYLSGPSYTLLLTSSQDHQV